MAKKRRNLTPQAILEALDRSDRGPLKPKELARALAVSNDQYGRFRRLLRDLEREGRVYRVRGRRYAVPKKLDLIVGRLEVTRKGNAFLVTGEGRDDVFVNARHLETAMDGDRVVVRLEGHSRGRPFGRVIKIVERAHSTVVGPYRRTEPFGTVTPRDPKLRRNVLIPQGHEGSARDGDVVVVEILSFPSRRTDPVGRVAEVLGREGDPGVDILAIVHAYGLPVAFSDEVEAAAHDAIVAVDSTEEPSRADRRDLCVFTIDPADAKDHDDALSLVELEDGTLEVGIHIADVARYVASGSPVDLEAVRRGTSVYLVDRVVPMLPHALSSGVCSLVPDQDRRAVSLFVRMDRSAGLLEHRFERTWIRSRHRLSYEDAQAALDGRRELDPITKTALTGLCELAKILRRKRMERGSIDFDLPETRVVLSDDGRPLEVAKLERLESHRLIEDFMLLANELVAREGHRRNLPLLYRIHHPPDPDRLEDLREFLAHLGYSLPDRPTPKALQRVVGRAQGRPEEQIVSTAVLRSMMRARYAAVDDGHYGLALTNYAHFTSPIRRYPDLHVHRILVGALTGVEDADVADWSTEDLQNLADQTSRSERVADEAERDSTDLKKIEYMERHVGDDMPGTISNVRPYGFFVQLDDVFIEGLVHVSSLRDDFYHLHERQYALIGERRGRIFRLGDPVRVTVARVDRSAREIDFVVADGKDTRD